VGISEREIRQRYQSAPDGELQEFALQGSDAYTAAAWRLLCEEMTRRGLTPPAPSIPGPDPREYRSQRTAWSVAQAAVVVVVLMLIAAAWAWRIHPDYQRRCGLVVGIGAWQCGALLWPIWWPKIVRGTLYGAATLVAIRFAFWMRGRPIGMSPEEATAARSTLLEAGRRSRRDREERANRA